MKMKNSSNRNSIYRCLTENDMFKYKTGISRAASTLDITKLNFENLNSHSTAESNFSKGETLRDREVRKGPAIAGNIKVLCRFRPLTDKEKENTKEVICEIESEKTIKINQREKEDETRDSLYFSFDHIFRLDTVQKDVYTIAAQPLVDSKFFYKVVVLEGYNGTILVYGQTASGKTYTMQGILNNPELEGIIPRMINHVFTHVSNSDNDIEYLIKVSIIEIYMEKIKDLLDPTRNNLKIRDDKIKGVYIEDLSEHYVINDRDVLNLIQIGSDNRSVAQTNMNASSSRSHLVFQLTIQQNNKADASSKIGKLFLVDLAGSEKMGKSGAKAQTFEEGKMINKSLTTLGMVINALTDGRSIHVPYRESVLTRVLSESLGGNAKTHLIITCSPSLYNESETLSTLRFGDRAKKIKNNAKINKEETVPKLKERIANLEKILINNEITIQTLKKTLKNNGLQIPKINFEIQENDSEEEIEEKIINEETNKINNESAENNISHSIDPEIKLLIEFDEKEQQQKLMEQTLIELENKIQELQNDKENCEKLIVKLKRKNFEKKNIILEKINFLKDQQITISNLEDWNEKIMNENEDFLKINDEKNEEIEKLNITINSKLSEIKSLKETLDEKSSKIELMNKLSLEKDSKLVEKENILRNLNNLIEEKEKTIKENANLYFNNPLIKNCPEININTNLINLSNKNKENINLLNDFFINLEQIESLKTSSELKNLMRIYKDKLDLTENSFNKSSSIGRKLEKHIQTEKIIQFEIGNFIEFSIINNDKHITQQELTDRHITLMHQMMNQKVLFQIEKRILENKIKKRQDNITDLEIQNHKFKEELRLLEEKSLFIQKGKSINTGVVKVITKHSILPINKDKINSLYGNIQNNWNKLDLSISEHNKTSETDKIIYNRY